MIGGGKQTSRGSGKTKASKGKLASFYIGKSLQPAAGAVGVACGSAKWHRAAIWPSYPVLWPACTHIAIWPKRISPHNAQRRI